MEIVIAYSLGKKNKENVTNLSSAVFAQRVMKITFGYDMSVNLQLHDTSYIVSYCIAVIKQ